MYQKVQADMRFAQREEEIVKFWREKDIFSKTIALREGAEVFMFYDGPPTANGRPHIGHVETRAFKDLIPRHRTMKGYSVPRKAGWDTHGLPVELEVEKALGLNGKPQIETYGVEPFIKACKESVWVYKREWEEMSERVGFWADMEHPYVTYENNYIESVWWSLKTIFDKGLLYKGHKTVPYCPRCGTALSSHEVAQGYKDVTDASATVKFRVKGMDNTYLLAWTTTPWTLPSNVALVVNAKEEYVYAQDHGETYILAKALVEKNLCEHAHVVKTVKGAELVGMEYERLYPFAGEVKEKGWYVVADDYVTLTDGTGIVHCAPAFGEDDARVGRDYGMPFVQLVDAQGRMTAETGDWAGLFVKDADPRILEELKTSGRLLKSEPYTHNYPFCWRCDTPLIYYARASWFIRMTEVRDELVANNRSVNWYPDNIKEGRMGKFVENVVDWAVTRERYWGTPMPLWVCECGNVHAIGSIAELMERGKNVREGIELHKPYIDEVELTCEKCGGAMRRTPEVIDCWYDAGSMPFAQLHYPFENKELFEKTFPAAFISEAIDQTRGWFYTLLAISTLLFGRAPFENCLVLGLVLDKDGVKMSKHVGNVIAPADALNQLGADAVRWYFYANGAPWLPSRVSLDMVGEMQRKFMGTLWNTYAFYILYAQIDAFDPTQYMLKDMKLSVMDRWVLSRLNTLVAQVDRDLTGYRVTEAARAMQGFVEELSNWYVRRGRERYWGKDMTEDKAAAFMTLYTVLETLARLAAPFVPFMTEQMYRNLVLSVDKNAPESVHLCDYPASDTAMIDETLEKQMELALEIVNLARAARAKSQLKTRQPLSTLYVRSEKEGLKEEYAALVADELNVKKVVFTSDTRDFTTYRIKPQLRTLGPRYGKALGAIGEYLAAADGNDLVDALETAGEILFTVSEVEVRLSREDMLIDPIQKEGYLSETGRDMTVVLDANLTESLIEEGLVREVISKLQTMRKEADFEVTDRIRVWMAAGEKLTAAIRANEAEVLSVVLGDGIEYAEAEGGKAWDINGETAVLAVRKAGS